MMRPITCSGCKEGRDSVFLPGCMAHYFATFANALVWLDMRTGRYFLQEDLDWLRADLAFESEDTSRFDWHGSKQKIRKQG